MQAKLTCYMYDGDVETEELTWPADADYAAKVIDGDGVVLRAVVTNETGDVLAEYEYPEYDPYENADEGYDTRCDRW